jgi:hypothetical protein
MAKRTLTKPTEVATPHDITLPPDSSRYRRARWICRTAASPRTPVGKVQTANITDGKNDFNKVKLLIRKS